jgi:hypothetical protein
VDSISADCETVDLAPEPQPEQQEQPQQPGGGGGEPGPGGGGTPDTSLQFALGGSRAQRVLAQKAVRVTVACPAEPCTAVARASGRLPRLSRSSRAGKLTLKPVTAAVAAGTKRTLKLRLSKAQLAALRRAIAARRSATLVVTAEARDAAGNRVVRTLRVRVKR